FDDSPLTVVGDASLGGELVLNVTDPGSAELYQPIGLLFATSLEGTFDTVSGPLVDGVAFAVTYDAAEVLVTPAFFGDADLDGNVDLADFGILRAGFGEAGTWVDADFDQDGDVDLADFGLLRANFGSSVTPADLAMIDAWAATVPEPSVLLLAALPMVLARRR
ncbi:MAG: hypothetical protein AAGI46_16490, partial [Planctomycetota bacterium]